MSQENANMTTMRARFFLIALGVLGAATVAAEPAKFTSTSPPTWWEVAPSSNDVALAVGCRSDELVFVDAKQRVRIRPGSMSQLGAERWEWTISLGTPTIRCTLEREAKGPAARLTCSDGTRREQFSLREAGAARGQELEALVAAKRPPMDICAKAELCCPVAFSMLGAKCNLDLELGSPRQTDNCDGFMKGMQIIFAEKKLKLPSACAQ